MTCTSSTHAIWPSQREKRRHLITQAARERMQKERKERKQEKKTLAIANSRYALLFSRGINNVLGTQVTLYTIS